MHRRSLVVIACSALVAAATVAASDAHAAGEVEFSAGAKGLLGGSLFTSPSNVPFGYSGLGFAGSAGGLGWGAEAYGEARIYKYLGIEVGVGYDHTDLHRNVTYNGTVTVTERVTSKSLRIPILVKGVVPVPFGRISLGVGPEIVSAMTPDASLELPSNASTNTVMSATKAGSMRLLFDFGLAIDLGDRLELPIGLRMSKATGQPDAWTDRVHAAADGSAYAVEAESSWDFRFVVGLGARF